MKKFHFAIPRRIDTLSRVSEAAAHIEETFGIAGIVRHARTNPGFTLYYIEHDGSVAEMRAKAVAA